MTKLLGPHPQPAHPLSVFLDAVDETTASKRQHRRLTEIPDLRDETVEFFRPAVARHHGDPEKKKRISAINKALARQGFEARSVYPANPSTRKGNFAEIVLAEYVVATEHVSLPVYRLRYNPNVDQSMKGDDVLAFDLDAKPMRILVGESKFRGTPRREHVEEIVEGLLRSHRAKIPVSLQFVADRLYEAQQVDLARRVETCSVAIARGQVQLDYVGLLLGSGSAGNCVNSYTPDGQPKRLAMVSLAVVDPEALVDDCFRGLT